MQKFLLPCCRGPYRVLEVLGNGTVVLSTGATSFKDAIVFSRHVSNLAVYYDKAAARAALRA